MTDFEKAVAEAVQVAYARALGDGKAKVAFAPKALCDSLNPEIEMIGRAAVLSSDSGLHGSRQTTIADPEKMTNPTPDLPAYLAGILTNQCLWVVKAAAMKAIDHALDGVIVSTPIGQSVVQGGVAHLAGFRFQIKFTLG